MAAMPIVQGSRAAGHNFGQRMSRKGRHSEHLRLPGFQVHEGGTSGSRRGQQMCPSNILAPGKAVAERLALHKADRRVLLSSNSLKPGLSPPDQTLNPGTPAPFLSLLERHSSLHLTSQTHSLFSPGGCGASVQHGRREGRGLGPIFPL